MFKWLGNFLNNVFGGGTKAKSSVFYTEGSGGGKIWKEVKKKIIPTGKANRSGWYNDKKFVIHNPVTGKYELWKHHTMVAFDYKAIDDDYTGTDWRVL